MNAVECYLVMSSGHEPRASQRRLGDMSKHVDVKITVWSTTGISSQEVWFA